jgi:hypothetical protein
MLVGRCPSELSSHKLHAKSKKSQPPSEAEGSAVQRTSLGNVSPGTPKLSRCGLQNLVDGAVEIFVGTALLIDLGDGMHHRSVVLATERR